jgi:HEAT repeat protein
MNIRTQTSKVILWACVVVGGPLAVHADETKQHVVYDRERGELSPGTEAPSSERMVNAIRSASPTALTAMLEYGERVECFECIPLLQSKLLQSGDSRVREIAAWWLRRRTFGYGRAAVAMRATLAEDADAVRRARAAEALGEFLDVRGLPALQEAVMNDDDTSVRVAAVRALGRLNAREGASALASAMQDDAPEVRRAALDQVLRVSFFAERDALVTRLGDEDSDVRLRAAQLIGELRVQGSHAALSTTLLEDGDSAVRQAAAWALGRVGGEGVRSTLEQAREAEGDRGVQDAIAVALRM